MVGVTLQREDNLLLFKDVWLHEMTWKNLEQTERSVWVAMKAKRWLINAWSSKPRDDWSMRGQATQEMIGQ